LLREWLYAVKPGTTLRRATMRTEDLLLLAREHFDLWQRLGVFTEPYHLTRSKELFQEYFESRPNYDDTDDLITYFKVLQHLGEVETAADIITKVITYNDQHPDYANFLFYAGVIYKALGDYDKANHFFFESQEVGPPKLLTKLDMMIIISRLLEESNREEEIDEEAYHMVYSHMIYEGLISEDVEYDDWISSSKTWFQLADKCAFHQMYSLATDFYGLGITRDPDAFKKPMLWYRFAKSCRRCGRVADTQLAIKQALTRSPYNRQLLDAQRSWLSNTNKFLTTLNKDFHEIFQLIPRASRVTVRAFHRLQSFVRGNAMRKQIIRGIGGRKDIKKRMFARVGILFAEKYPILIRARADWMGQVKTLLLYDVKSQVTKHMKLKYAFTPILEVGAPRKLRLHLSWERVKKKPTELKNIDDDASDSTGDDTIDDFEDFEDKIILTLKFVDDLNKAYVQRKIVLILTENPSETLPLQNRIEDGRSILNLLTFDSVPEYRIEGQHPEGDEMHEDPDYLISPPHELNDETSDNQKLIAKTILKDIYINNYYEKHVETNIIVTEVTRLGLIWHEHPFLIRILNDRDVTQINIFSVKNNMNLLFLTHRENITRSVDIKSRCERLLSFMSQHHRLQRYLPTSALRNNLKAIEESHLTAEDLEARERFNFFQGKNCFIKLLPEGNGVSIILADSQTDPVIGDLYERCTTIGERTLDTTKFTKLAISRSLYRDSYSQYAFSPPKPSGETFVTIGEHLETLGDDNDNGSRSPIMRKRDPIMDAIKVARELVEGAGYLSPEEDEGIVIGRIGPFSPQKKEKEKISTLSLPHVAQLDPLTKQNSSKGKLLANDDQEMNARNEEKKDIEEPEDLKEYLSLPVQSDILMKQRSEPLEPIMEHHDEEERERSLSVVLNDGNSLRNELQEVKPTEAIESPIPTPSPSRPTIIAAEVGNESSPISPSITEAPPSLKKKRELVILVPEDSASSLELEGDKDKPEGVSSPVSPPPSLQIMKKSQSTKNLGGVGKPEKKRSPKKRSAKNLLADSEQEKQEGTTGMTEQKKKEKGNEKEADSDADDPKKSTERELAAVESRIGSELLYGPARESILEAILGELIPPIVSECSLIVEEENRRQAENSLIEETFQWISRDFYRDCLLEVVEEGVYRKKVQSFSQELTTELVDYSATEIVHRAIEERSRQKNAKLVSLTAQTISVAFERQLEESINQLFEVIINEEISWEILLEVFFYYFVHSLVKEVADLAVEEIEREIEEEIIRQEQLDQQRHELRKKVYYPNKIRSTVNENSHFLRDGRKDPSLVPIAVNAWTEELSQFSTVSPTRATRTMSSVRHRDHARSVTFIHSLSAPSSAQTATNSSSSINGSTTILPRPKTSSVVAKIKDDQFSSPQQLVRALRAKDCYDDPFAGPTKGKGGIRSISPENSLIHHQSPVLSECLSVELATIANYNSDDRRNSRNSHSRGRERGRGTNHGNRSGSPLALPLFYQNNNNNNNSTISNGNGNGNHSRPVTAPAAAGTKDKSALYNDSLKQIHRLGFAPSSAGHFLVDLADGQPLRRPWDYTAYWQNLLTAFIKYHANLPSVKLEQQNPNPNPNPPPPSVAGKDPFSVNESLEEINSLSSSYGFDDKEAFEIFRDRPPFWLLRKQLTILLRAIRPEKFHSIPIKTGFSHLPKYELIKTKGKTPTIEQLVCCLAECRGSVGEVIEKIYNLEFIKEIELVCDAINVKALICAVPYADSLYNSFNTRSSSSPIDRSRSRSPSSRPGSTEKKRNRSPFFEFSQLSATSTISNSQSKATIEWKESSQVLENILHKRNEEIKLYNKTKQRRDNSIIVVVDNNNNNDNNSDNNNNSSSSPAIRRSKIIRRNSSLCLTDFESDETFVVALKKVLAMNDEMINIQRSIGESSPEEKEERGRERGRGRGKAEKQKSFFSPSCSAAAARPVTMIQSAGGSALSATNSHIATGLGMLPTAGLLHSRVSKTSLDASSALVRSRASFVNVSLSVDNHPDDNNHNNFHYRRNSTNNNNNNNNNSPSLAVPRSNSNEDYHGNNNRRKSSSSPPPTSILRRSPSLEEQPPFPSSSSPSSRSPSLQATGMKRNDSSSSFVNKLRASRSQMSFHDEGILLQEEEEDEEETRGGDEEEEDRSLVIGFPENSMELPGASYDEEEGERERNRKTKNHSDNNNKNKKNKKQFLSSSFAQNQKTTLNNIFQREPSWKQQQPQSSGISVISKREEEEEENEIKEQQQQLELGNTSSTVISKPTRKRSYHFEKYLIEEAFRAEDEKNNNNTHDNSNNDHNGLTNFTILSRKDARRLELEEKLLKSNKLYIREPIEKKIEMLSKKTPSILRVSSASYN
jgi:tetratricopeptide (TPR) repeat protein/ribosomal protein S18